MNARALPASAATARRVAGTETRIFFLGGVGDLSVCLSCVLRVGLYGGWWWAGDIIIVCGCAVSLSRLCRPVRTAAMMGPAPAAADAVGPDTTTPCPPSSNTRPMQSTLRAESTAPAVKMGGGGLRRWPSRRRLRVGCECVVRAE